MTTRPSADESGERFATTQDAELPPLGFGTYRLGGYTCFDAVQTALDAGYRHIDTAMAYENEAVVGRAIETSPVDRDDVFVTTKLKGYPEFLEYDKLLEIAEGCLERLGMDHVDLLLLHWWHPSGDMEEVFSAMSRLVAEGKARNIGVSNFSTDQLQTALRVSDAPIVTNQVEYHPYFEQDELLEFCQENDVLLTAYSPLAEGQLVNDDTLATIGRPHGKSAAQVALRWLIQQENVVTIPRAATPSHARENIDVFDFELTDREMHRIADLDGPIRYQLATEMDRFRGALGPYVPKPIRRRIP